MSTIPTLGITISTLKQMRVDQEKIACLTAYDASFAKVLDAAGVDLILIGDSLGMVIQGHESTVSVSMDDVIYHTRCVSTVTQRALVVADMPFMSYTTIDRALDNATRLMQEGGAQMVKLEATERQSDIVREMTACGIPVCAHLGLRPQYIHKLGGYHVQGKDQESATELRNTATALQEAGADMLLLECVPAALTEEITRSVGLPVIGIGAGSHCDGQILVLQDILGITPGKTPPFVRNYMSSGNTISQAVEQYVKEVKAGIFPKSD